MSAVKNLINTVKDKVSSSKPPILISGASGFLAAHVLNAFLSQGYHVRGTVRSEASAAKVRETHSKYANLLTFAIVPDIAAPGAFDEAVKGVGGVIHTVSPFTRQVENNERDLLNPAIKGTVGILTSVKAFAPQVKRVVITSSFAAIFDPSNKSPDKTYDESDWNPVTYEIAKNSDNSGVGYQASKTLAERAAWEFVEAEKPNFTIATICPPMIYGPLEHSASLDHLNTSSADIYRFMNGSSKEVGPTFMPAFADVRDVAEAHRKAFEHRTGGRFFITSGNFQYNDVCEILKGMPEVDSDKVPDPSSTPRSQTFYKVDNSKAKRELGIDFKPLITTITDTARTLVELQKARV